MPIKIQNTKTLKTYEIDKDAKLYYNVLSPIEQKRLLFQNMTNGKIEQDRIFEMSYEFMELMVKDWEGIIDGDTEEPIKFDKSLIKVIPLELAIDFVVKIVVPSFQGLISSAENLTGKKEEKESTEGN